MTQTTILNHPDDCICVNCERDRETVRGFDKRPQTTTPFQFVTWFPQWVGFSLNHPTLGMSRIYEWCLALGFWEVRKWKRQ